MLLDTVTESTSQTSGVVYGREGSVWHVLPPCPLLSPTRGPRGKGSRSVSGPNESEDLRSLVGTTRTPPLVPQREGEGALRWILTNVRFVLHCGEGFGKGQ